MKKQKTELEAAVRNGKIVITKEIYEGRKYIPGKNKYDDARHRKNFYVLHSFFERAQYYWLNQ